MKSTEQSVDWLTKQTRDTDPHKAQPRSRLDIKPEKLKKARKHILRATINNSIRHTICNYPTPTTPPDTMTSDSKLENGTEPHLTTNEPQDTSGATSSIAHLESSSKEAIQAAARAVNESEATARAKASTKSIRAAIRSSAHTSLVRTDATMAHLNRLLATPSHTDTLLMTTSYSLSLLHSFLSSTIQHRLEREAASLISKLRSTPLLPGESLVATISPSTTSVTYRLQTSSKALARLIDDFRMFTRLLSLVKMWAWGAATLRNPARDPLLKSVVWTQVVSCSLYQVLENAAYLATKGVLDLSGERIIKFYRWSSRFWAVHVAFEFVRLWRMRELQAKAGTDDEKVQAKWWRDVYVNAAWMPMTWHYSVAGGLISDSSVAALGLVAGVFGLREAWKVTA